MQNVSIVPTAEDHFNGLRSLIDSVARERLGFVQEGVKRQARKLDGRYDDLIIMAIDLSASTPPAPPLPPT